MKAALNQYRELLARYLGPQWLRAVWLALLILGGIALQLVNPQIVRRFIDTAQSGATLEGLLRIALAFIGVALAQQAVSVLATYSSENLGWITTNALREDLAQHCLSLDMTFHNAHTPGEMIERIDGDVTSLASFFSEFLLQLVANALLLTGVLAILFYEDWRVGLALGAFALLALIVLSSSWNIAVPHFAGERQASADFFGFVEERLTGTEDIRACGAKAYVMRGFYRLTRTWMQKSLKAGLMVNVMINAVSSLVLLGPVVALAVGGYLFLRGSVTIGTVYLIFQYGSMLAMPINRITQQMQDLQRAGASVERVRALLGTESRIQDIAEAEVKVPLGADLGPRGQALAAEFRNVSFGYAESSPREGSQAKPQGAAPEVPPVLGEAKEMVLHDLSFRLAPGQILGLLGRTGSGKTTLTRLLFRLYDPDRGSILLSCEGDGEHLSDIRQLSLAGLRRRVGMVTQEIQLFHASVRDNLTFFAPADWDEQILQVIHELGLGQWYASLPQGLDTVLESGGGGLSAGEAQLLAFVRVFLQDPGLVILDEASARLDPATEQLIERAVDRLVENRTAIVIAHRLGTVQRADEIMILEEGRIGEYGPREALAADPTSRFAGLLRTGLEEVLA
jgi:ATP-binding cassette subfamily B protein